jgi:antitoxin CcdA
MRMSDFDDPARPFRRDDSPRPRKRTANVSIDADILAEAKALKINLSQALEEKLRARVTEERIKRWQSENRAFFESYNSYVQRNGTLSEALPDADAAAV